MPWFIPTEIANFNKEDKIRCRQGCGDTEADAAAGAGMRRGLVPGSGRHIQQIQVHTWASCPGILGPGHAHLLSCLRNSILPKKWEG